MNALRAGYTASARKVSAPKVSARKLSAEIAFIEIVLSWLHGGRAETLRAETYARQLSRSLHIAEFYARQVSARRTYARILHQITMNRYDYIVFRHIS